MTHCAETEKAYQNFMNTLIKTKKGVERDSYMEGHREANVFLLQALEGGTDLESLKKGAEVVIKCIDRIKGEG